MLGILNVEKMIAVGTSLLVVLLILVCAWVAISLEDRKSDDMLLSELVDSVTREIDDDLAEQFWMNCILDLINVKESTQNLDLYFLDETFSITNEINSRSMALFKENIKKIVSVGHPQLKKILLDCLRMNILLQASGEKIGSNNWYKKYLGSVCSKWDIQGGNLGRALLESNSESPASPPANIVGSPNLSSDQSPDREPSSLQDPDSELLPPSSVDPLPHLSIKASKRQSKKASGSNEKKKRAILMAVIVTATTTVLLTALLFLCCTKVCRTGSGSRKYDERRLLSLSLSDHSVGSSFKEEKDGHHTFNTKPSSLDKSVCIESDVLNTSLPRPASHGLPPLRPPPGRVDPLPPEPHDALKPPPGRPSPPPPAPPSSLKSFSANTSPPPPLPPGPRSLGPHPTGPSPSGPPPPGAPPPPPAPGGAKPGPRAPPPPKNGYAPRPPQGMPGGPRVPRPPPGPNGEAEDDAPKTKLKPFFWDKVLASPDTTMVWDEIKGGSFQFNEEMIENLFGYNHADKNKTERSKTASSIQDAANQFIQIIDSKKSQNLSILLRALNVAAEEVTDAINEGNELPAELLQTLLKMAPTAEEELKLRLFGGHLSQLGPADRFLKLLCEIPFAFKKLEAFLFMSILHEEVTTVKESFATLEVACKELKNSRLFLKLLEAVLKTGNRMNDGTFRGGAQAFKLDTLLKLSDVKGIDGKTTLLHFVVQEIIRSEGLRAVRIARDSQNSSSIKTDDLLEDVPNQDSEEHYRNLGLQVVSSLGNDLENVKKAANLDADSITGTVSKLSQTLIKTRDFLNTDMENSEEKRGFYEALKSFVQHAEGDIMFLLDEEKRIMNLVKSAADYFHGSAAKDEGLRLFVIVRNFLIILDKVCKEVRDSQKKQKPQKKEAPSQSPSSEPPQSPPTVARQSPVLDPHQPPAPDLPNRLIPAITDRRTDSSSSDDDS